MADARSDILARIREALKVKAPRPHLRAEPTDRRPAKAGKPWLPDGGESREASLAILAEQLAKLKAVLVRAPDVTSAASALADLAKSKGWQRAAVHSDALLKAACATLPCPVWDVAEAFDKRRLEGCDVGITTCECLVAQLGSALVSSRSSGGRGLSILPHVHVIVATVDQVMPDLDTAFAAVRDRNAGGMPSMLSFITGPSRTGDIERILVLGAHGPKELYVILIG